MSATATPMGAEPVGGLSACGSFSGKMAAPPGGGPKKFRFGCFFCIIIKVEN